MVGANHGGGYLYSVCPAGSALNEECFNGHVLPFVGGNTTIRYLDGRGQKIIPATDVTEGTSPPGSAWRRNPVPACNSGFGVFVAKPRFRGRSSQSILHTVFSGAYIHDHDALL